MPLEPESWSLFSSAGLEPDAEAEQSELLATLQRAIADVLTPHQRRVLVALALNGVPIDVLAERLEHDARRALQDAARRAAQAAQASRRARAVARMVGGDELMERPDLKQALGRLLGPAEPEVGCDECFDELDRYVELELAGEDADAAIPGPARPPRRLPRLPRGAREPARARRRRAVLEGLLALRARFVVGRLDRLRVQRPPDVLARVDVGDRLLDLAQSSPELPCDLRNLLRTEQEQEDEYQRDQLPMTRHTPSIDSSERSAVRVSARIGGAADDAVAAARVACSP